MAANIDSALLGDPCVLFPCGLRSANGKFLTLESFGNQLNWEGKSLMTKQVWLLETDGKGLHSFKNQKGGKYLTADLDVKADVDSAGDKEKWSLEYDAGVVSLKNTNGKYLSVSGTQIGLAAGVGDDTKIEIVINYHPQVCLLYQKRYVSCEKDQILTQAASQFGLTTCLTMEAADNDPAKLRGQWRFRAGNGKFLYVDGSGSVKCDKDGADDSANFALQFHGNQMAVFNVQSGKYLSAAGSGLKAARATVGAKEIVRLVDSDAQITLKAHNGKYFSFQGANIMCQRSEVTNEEIFIMEHKAGKWAFRTVNEVYVVCDGGKIALGGKERGDNAFFEMEFHDGKLSLKAGGKYVHAKPLGGIDMVADNGPECHFEHYFYNRPRIVLQSSSQTFVAAGSDGKKVLSNKALPDTWDFEFDNGKYALKHSTGKYIVEGAEGRVELGGQPEWFFIEFHNNKINFKTQKGKFLEAEGTSGYLVAKAAAPNTNTEFEF